MSGGEQQRAAIARAMIAHPAVILADEPTGNLDVASAQTVVQMLAEASNEYNQTIIMVRMISRWQNMQISCLDS